MTTSDLNAHLLTVLGLSSESAEIVMTALDDERKENALLRAEIFRLKGDAEVRERILDVNCEMLPPARDSERASLLREIDALKLAAVEYERVAEIAARRVSELEGIISRIRRTLPHTILDAEHREHVARKLKERRTTKETL